MTIDDPHVESLEYRFVSDPTRVYESPSPVEGDAAAFKWRLADGRLTVTMKDHHATVPEARAAVDAFVRAWEIDLALKYGHREVRFEFDRPKVIDRASGTVLLAGVTATVTTARATLTVTHRKYPEPPIDFAVSPDVETLWNRYEGYTLEREPLPSMAYFCLTLIQTRYGNGSRKRAALSLNAQFRVLDMLGKLTDGGAPTIARKFKTSPRELSGRELAWIEAAIKALIRRVGMKAAGAQLTPRLTMEDLPKL